MSQKMESLFQKYRIQLQVTSPYHLQANGKVEGSNKMIESILAKIVKSHRKDWVDMILEALRAYLTTWWNTTRFSPYKLVYGKGVVFPIKFEIKQKSCLILQIFDGIFSFIEPWQKKIKQKSC